MLKRDVHDETVLYEAVNVELFALFLDKREGPKACRNVDEEAVVCYMPTDTYPIKSSADCPRTPCFMVRAHRLPNPIAGQQW